MIATAAQPDQSVSATVKAQTTDFAQWRNDATRHAATASCEPQLN
jgi:hypothetical protein